MTLNEPSADRSAAQSPVSPAGGRPAIRWNELEILGRLVSRRTTSEHRAWVKTGTDTFELTDLPIGVPIEIGAVGTTGAGLGAFVPEDLLRTTAVHGNAEPLEVRIRRVRE